MRIVISIPMEKNRDSHFCKNRAALVSSANFRSLTEGSLDVLSMVYREKSSGERTLP